MKININAKQYFFALIVLMVTLLVTKHLHNVYKVIVSEKSTENYEKNIYSDTRLARLTGVEYTPPHLLFNHSAVLSAGINAIGVVDKPYFSFSQHEQLQLQIPKEFSGLVTNYSNVNPFFGKKMDRLFYNGFTYDSKLVVPQIDSTMKELIGRRGRIAYQGGAYSNDVFIFDVEDGYVKITGSILRDKRPLSLELYKVPARTNFSVPIEKISFLPFMEDGIGRLPDSSIAIRLRDNQSILHGDALEISGKTKLVTSVLDGPGAVKFIVTDSSGYIPYVDTRHGIVNVIPKAREKIPALYLPIKPVTDNEFYNGQQRYVLVDTNEKLHKGLKCAIVTFPGYSIPANYISDGVFSFDYGESSSIFPHNCFENYGFNSHDSTLIEANLKLEEKSNKRKIPNITMFGFDASRKNIPLLVSYQGPNGRQLLSDNKPKIERKKWLGERLWSTYTGLINQYYNTFNPSGFEYIIHALGPENREKYKNSFEMLSPEYVQTSVRNFDFTDFHGWSLTNSWEFYRLLLASYAPIVSADYAQIWKLSNDKVRQPKIIYVRNAVNFPMSVGVSKTKPVCDEIRIVEIKIDYELNNKLRFIPLIGKTPRLIVYVNGAISALPISLPPDLNTWIFPIAYSNSQFPTIDIRVHSPILPNPALTVKNVEIRELDIPQNRLRALFLPATVKSSDLCQLK